MLYHVLSLKGEPKKVKKKIVEYNLFLLAHKGYGFHSYVVLHNLPQWRSVSSLFKNGADVASLEKFNGYVDPIKKVPQYVIFRCGLLHIKDSSRNIGKSYNIQESLLKQEIEHDEIYEDN